MNAIHFSSELYLPLSMMNYLLLHHRLTSLSYLMLPPLLLQKGLAWPTAIASFPRRYADM